MSFWGSAASMELNAQAIAQRNRAIQNGNDWAAYARQLEAQNAALQAELSTLKTEHNMQSASLRAMRRRVAELKGEPVHA